MLTKESAIKLLKLISDEKNTMETIHEQFHTSFSIETRFPILSSLSYMIQDQVLNHVQQIISIFILYSEFMSENQDNPFLPFFIYINNIQEQTPNIFPPVLSYILSCIISGSNLQQMLELNVHEILNYDFSNINKINIQLPFQFSRQSPILSKARPNTLKSIQNEVFLSNDELIIQYLTNDEFTVEFKPPQIRPIPDIMPIFQGELEGIASMSPFSPPFIFDSSLFDNSKTEFDNLFKKALESKLTEEETQKLINSQFFKEISFQETLIDTLIAKDNQNVVISIVERSFEDNPNVKNYLIQLHLNTKTFLILKSIILFLKSDVQEKFIQDYAISNIDYLNRLYQNDPSLWNTNSRLFCRFLNHLKSSNVNFTNELNIELKGFCVNLAAHNINDAQELYFLS